MAAKRKSGVKTFTRTVNKGGRIVRAVEGQERATAGLLLSPAVDGASPAPLPADDPPVQQPSPSPELYTRSCLIETAIRLATTYQQQLYAARRAQKTRQQMIARGATDLPLVSFPNLTEYITAMELVGKTIRDMGVYEDTVEFGRAVAFLILGPDQQAFDQQGG